MSELLEEAILEKELQNIFLILVQVVAILLKLLIMLKQLQLRGMGSRYKEEESLISLEIVEQISGRNNIKIYKLTDFGQEIIGSFKKP